MKTIQSQPNILNNSTINYLDEHFSISELNDLFAALNYVQEYVSKGEYSTQEFKEYKITDLLNLNLKLIIQNLLNQVASLYPNDKIKEIQDERFESSYEMLKKCFKVICIMEEDKTNQVVAMVIRDFVKTMIREKLSDEEAEKQLNELLDSMTKAGRIFTYVIKKATKPADVNEILLKTHYAQELRDYRRVTFKFYSQINCADELENKVLSDFIKAHQGKFEYGHGFKMLNHIVRIKNGGKEDPSLMVTSAGKTIETTNNEINNMVNFIEENQENAGFNTFMEQFADIDKLAILKYIIGLKNKNQELEDVITQHNAKFAELKHALIFE